MRQGAEAEKTGGAPHHPGRRPGPAGEERGRRRHVPGGMISPPPGPPQWAGRRPSRRGVFSSLAAVFSSRSEGGSSVPSGFPPFRCSLHERVPAPEAVFPPESGAGRGKRCRTLWPPVAESSGVRRSGGNLRESVYFVPAHAGRLRPGVAGPSCQGKGLQEQGKHSTGAWALFRPRFKHNAPIVESLPLLLFSGAGRKTVGRRRWARQRTPARSTGQKRDGKSLSAPCGPAGTTDLFVYASPACASLPDMYPSRP